MKRALTFMAIVSACFMGGGLLSGAIDLAPGSAVPDSVAAQLYGGCAGVCKADCGDASVCPRQAFTNNNCDPNPPNMNEQPGGNKNYCITKAGGMNVCDTCGAYRQSCGSNKGG